MSETKSPNGHRYKELLRSLVKKAKGSDLSVQKKELSESERNATEADVHYRVETTDAESFFARSKYERVDFVLRKIKYSGDGEKSNSHVTQTATGGSVEAELHVEYTKDKIHESHCTESQNESEKEDKKCSICRHGGKLLCCAAQGCERSYHLSCVNPPVAYVRPTIWHCSGCVQKKLKLGVHAVSEGMESILNTKEVMSDDEVLQKQQQRQYLVKYKGLAHIHSLWIPERQLICENPALLAKYQKHKQKVHWKTDWLVPHRLLDKRSLPFSMNFDSQVLNQDTNILDCRYEWLVKWTGLNYDKATWELENESFMRSPEAMKLVCDYESRHQKAERVTNSSKEDKERQNTFSALTGFLFGDSAGTCDRYFVHVNKLCDKWHKNQNALVIDDQEKIVKVVLFILSLQEKATQPFLIITRSTDISLWEAEFSRRASSANVIVYKGNTDVRTIIRTLEFYNKNGCVMFEVLIAPCVAIGEDFEMLGCISWDAIIVDDCQHPSILVQLRHIKMLQAGMRLLFVSGQIKERHCSSVLSLLDPQYGKIIEDCSDSLANHDIVKLKENLAQFVTYKCKSTRNTFVEYWVPVRLSNVQTELYCGSLFSNAELLSSYLKHDLTELLHDLLISTRKCCDHPKLVDLSLWSSVIQAIPEPEQLDAEIQLSSKLNLLHKILLEIKKRGLRVLILFQSLGGSRPIAIGDILDDIIHEKFGRDSYARIDGEMSRSKKRAALNIFNDKERGAFVLLMETRACLPSIQIVSLDTVIIFNSDWDPRNDLRAIQKINIKPQFEQLKIFRLYSSCTVEEKLLILAKRGQTLEGNIQNLKQSTCHGLLTWGAPYLFNKLDEFLDLKTGETHSIFSSSKSFVDDVFHELATLLPSNNERNDCPNNSFILEVQQIGGIYPRNISLLGELEPPLPDTFSMNKGFVDKEPPHVFWINLFEGRNPRWKYFSCQSPRTRRKLPSFNDLPEGTVNKKSRKEARSIVDIGPRDVKERNRNKLLIRNKERKLLGRKKNVCVGCKVKDISVECVRTEKVTGVNQQSKAATLKRRKPAISYSSSSIADQLPLNEDDDVPATIRMTNDRTRGTTGPSFWTQDVTQPPFENSIRPLELSVQHSTGDAPLQYSVTSHMAEDGREPRATSLSPTTNSGNSCPAVATQVTHCEPLQSTCSALHMELEILQMEKNHILKLHDDMKQQLKLACEKEIDQIHKNYDMQLQNAETTFLEKKEVLETRCHKVYINKVLAEVLMQPDNSENAIFSQVSTNSLSEEIYQLVLQQTGSRTVTRPAQLEESQPISSLPGCSVVHMLNQASSSARITTGSYQPSASPCMTLTQPVTSPEPARCHLAVHKSFELMNQAPPEQQIPVRTPSQSKYSSNQLITSSPSITPALQGLIQSSKVNPSNAESTMGSRQASASKPSD